MDREITTVAYRYLLDHEVDGSDQSQVIDALEDETFPIREILGEAEMVRQIKDGRLTFDFESTTRLEWFGAAVQVLSIYLSEYIIGLELAEGRNAAGIRVQVEVQKYVGRVGELIRVPLTHQIEFPSGAIAPGLEDLEYLRAHFHALPRWAQDAYRIKFPELRAL